MFVGGSRVLGSFDPFDKDATLISVTLGVIYVVAAVLFPLSFGFYFARYRPGVRQARDHIRDASILTIQREISELRNEIAALWRHKNTS
jgi:hypothetical protein